MAEAQYKLDLDPTRKGVMIGRLQDGRVMCVTVEQFVEAMRDMPMSYLDNPNNWLGYEEAGRVWVESQEVVQQA
jgi:hypothetical protein